MSTSCREPLTTAQPGLSAPAGHSRPPAPGSRPELGGLPALGCALGGGVPELLETSRGCVGRGAVAPCVPGASRRPPTGGAAGKVSKFSTARECSQIFGQTGGDGRGAPPGLPQDRRRFFSRGALCPESPIPPHLRSAAGPARPGPARQKRGPAEPGPERR